MSDLCDNENDPLARISMPRAVLDLFNCRLMAIARSNEALDVHLLSERAQGLIEALEVLNLLAVSELDSLYLIIENATQTHIKGCSEWVML